MLNSVQLHGRIVRDPIITTYNDGKKFVRYTLAVDRIGKDAGTDFVPCTCFGKAAEFASKFLKKGSEIVILGKVKTGSYVKKDGQRVYTTDIWVDSHDFCSGSKAKKDEEEPFDYANNVPDGNGFDDEAPFA